MRSTVTTVQVTSKAAHDIFFPTLLLCLGANTCLPAGWVAVLTKAGRNGPAAAAGSFPKSQFTAVIGAVGRGECLYLYRHTTGLLWDGDVETFH